MTAERYEEREETLLSAAGEILANKELDYLARLNTLENYFRLRGLVRQRNIVLEIIKDELDRIDPAGHWSAENGQSAPKKIPVNWRDM
jgi:hypothetical protein